MTIDEEHPAPLMGAGERAEAYKTVGAIETIIASMASAGIADVKLRLELHDMQTCLEAHKKRILEGCE